MWTATCGWCVYVVCVLVLGLSRDSSVRWMTQLRGYGSWDMLHCILYMCMHMYLGPCVCLGHSNESNSHTLALPSIGLHCITDSGLGSHTHVRLTDSSAFVALTSYHHLTFHSQSHLLLEILHPMQPSHQTMSVSDWTAAAPSRHARRCSSRRHPRHCCLR